jgi:hypothetical protein
MSKSQLCGHNHMSPTGAGNIIAEIMQQFLEKAIS